MQPSNNNGSIIIRFTKFGYKYSLTNLGRFDDTDNHYEAIRVCRSIELDISMGRFTARSNDELFTTYHPLAKLSSHHEINAYADDALSLIDKHLKTLIYKDKVLLPARSLLTNYGKSVKTYEAAMQFFTWISNDGKRSPNSNNRYLESLKAVCPMFTKVTRCKPSKVIQEKPFTKSEIKQIIDIFDKDFSHYSSFIKFLFSTGCRTSEAIALRWQDVDFEAKTITISESIGIASDGSKVRKSTKTGVSRTIPMSGNLLDLLNHRHVYAKQSAYTDLVFYSNEAKLIDIGNFRLRVWVKALELADVPYRTLYNTRHTFCSHFLNETPDFIKLASITHGTKSGVQTLIKHYAHIVETVTMPTMF